MEMDAEHAEYGMRKTMENFLELFIPEVRSAFENNNCVSGRANLVELHKFLTGQFPGMDPYMRYIR